MLIPITVSGLLIIVAYLLGSIPTGYIAGRYLKGIDIRECGSGSTGATNVLRTLGKPAAIAVLAIDALKGALAIALVELVDAFSPKEIIPNSWLAWIIVGAALGAVIGHSKSIFLNFTGGKSVATSLGVLLAMTPKVGLSTLGVFAIAIAITRIVSISSIFGAIAVGLFMYLYQQPLAYIIFGLIGGIYVIFRHRTNIERLLAGTEPKIGKTVEN
jgi:glycerol-3-phosphate acyltransferase PlsY